MTRSTKIEKWAADMRRKNERLRKQERLERMRRICRTRKPRGPNRKPRTRKDERRPKYADCPPVRSSIGSSMAAWQEIS
jgi:hypothetical protein